MLRLAIPALVGIGITLSGCAGTPDRLLLQATSDQTEIIRDGIPSLVSKKKHVVMLRPNARRQGANQRVAFTLVVLNRSSQPLLLRESSIAAQQFVGNKQVELKVYRHAALVQEEIERQQLAAFGAALSGVGNMMAASNAGYSNTTGSFGTYGPKGGSYGTYSASTYDPVRAQVAQSIAADRTAADFERIKIQGETNLRGLDSVMLQDNTIMPGEWAGGTIVLDPPQKDQSNVGRYAITVAFDGEVHSFAVSQGGT